MRTWASCIVGGGLFVSLVYYFKKRGARGYSEEDEKRRWNNIAAGYLEKVNGGETAMTLPRKLVLHPALFEAIGDVTHCSVLDFGCGNGWLVRSLRERGAKRAVGYDLSDVFVSIAKKQHADVDIEFTDKLESIQGCFDLVTNVLVLHTLQNLPACLRSMSALVARGGRLVIAILHPDHYRAHLLDGRPTQVLRIKVGGKIPVVYYRRSIPVYVSALEEAGLDVLKIEGAMAKKEEELPQSMEKYKRNPYFLLIIAVKR